MWQSLWGVVLKGGHGVWVEENGEEGEGGSLSFCCVFYVYLTLIITDYRHTLADESCEHVIT